MLATGTVLFSFDLAPVNVYGPAVCLHRHSIIIFPSSWLDIEYQHAA
jgi:hypothetical protein